MMCAHSKDSQYSDKQTCGVGYLMKKILIYQILSGIKFGSTVMSFFYFQTLAPPYETCAAYFCDSNDLQRRH